MASATLTHVLRAAREPVVTHDRFLVPPPPNVDLRQNLLHLGTIRGDVEERIDFLTGFVELLLLD